MPALAQQESVLRDGISQRHFKALAALIYDETGIKMPPTKLTMLEGRLRRRVRATGMSSLDAYCSHVLSDAATPEERVHLVNAVTTNKTDFFREPKHFEYLAETVLPNYVRDGRRRIRCWSAACSTGAEPYTLAMVLDDFAERRGGPDFDILATDLDTDVLATAVKGIYPDEMLEPVPREMRRRYVLSPKDESRRDVRISPVLRQKIGFGRLNLMDVRYPIGEAVDMIFCRNVLIYFDKPTQRQVVLRLCENLKPGGYLFFGHSESIAGFDLPLTPVANTVFRRD
ncbi:MAG TPA: protein-glutamate O-methyltransferase CheR [Sphingobium sp.]|uniref:CheR family methyltransferase n=1 Tax=Sphingobium sp. TaxID=1912891 RepID=UPI002ED21590